MPKLKKLRDLSRSQQNRRLKKFLILNKDCGDLKISTRLKNDVNLSTIMNQKEVLHQVVDINKDYEEILHDEKSESIKNESLQNDLKQYNSTNNYRKFINNNVYDDCEKCNKMWHAMNILREKISIWAITYNLPHNSVNALLHLFREAGVDRFPLDTRTLLCTPRITELTKTHSGEYLHYGLEHALKQQLQLLSNTDIEQNLQLNLHVDGLPISKSSQSVLWTLLGQIAYSNCLQPFVIGIFHGYCKPSQPEEILNEFCAEYLHLKQNGFMYQQKKYMVSIRAVLCDAPARAFVTCTLGHNGFFACTKCEVEGDYINNKMAFLKEDAQLRTDESFKNRTNAEYHKRQDKTPFELISLSMVSHFPLDYMHLVCLGIAKKILALCIDGCKTVKFSTAVKNKLSEDLISVAKWIPLEFARKVRSLDEFCRWKATEHRTFLLYVGPVVLQRYLPEANMKHYNSLHCAIRILCDPIDYKYNNEYAYNLLLYFVQVFKILYGPYNVSYNIHNVIHLPSDAMKFGPLDTFSCFPFENYLKNIKHLLRKGDKPLSQLRKRLDEMANFNVTKVEINSNDLFPLLLNSNKKQLPMGVSASHDNVKFKNFTLSCKRNSDCCCYLSDGSICSVCYIGKKNNHPVILGITLEDPQFLSNYPCNSFDLKICCGNKWSKLKEFKATEITNKAVRLFFGDTNYFFPMLHTSK